MTNHLLYPLLRVCVAAFTLLLIVVGTSCTEPITVGSDLLEDDRVNVGFNGGLEISTTTVLDDSIQMYDATNGGRLSRYLLGSTEDDIFGLTSRGVYITPELLRGGAGLVQPPLWLDNDSFIVDSLILVLPYDTASLYGDVYNTPVAYEVFEITDPFDQDADFYSNESLDLLPTPLTSGTFTVVPERRLVHDTLVIDSTLTHHVRIPLPMSLIERIVDADSTAYELDENFVSMVLAGLYIKTASVSNTFMGINPFDLQAAIYAYYTKSDGTVISFYPFDIDQTVADYSFDRSGSQAEFLLEQDINDEVALMEGAGGLMTRVEIFNADTLAGKIINQAQLEFYLDETADFDYDRFDPAAIVTLYYRDADGRLQVIEDIDILPAGVSAANREFFVGGNLQFDEEGRRFYQANLSVHLQRIVEGIHEPFVYIRVIPAELSPRRMVLRGPASSERPMVLKVAFTEF